MLTGYTTGSSKLVGMGELASPRISPRVSEARASSRFATCPEDLERVKKSCTSPSTLAGLRALVTPHSQIGVRVGSRIR